MGIFGNIQVYGIQGSTVEQTEYANLGKPTIKLEFDNNDDLLRFQRRFKEPEIDSEIWNYEDAHVVDESALNPLHGVELTEEEFFEIITANPAPNRDYYKKTETNILYDFPYTVYDKNHKKYYIIRTPLKDKMPIVYLSAKRLREHIQGGLHHKDKTLWAYVKPTIENPNIVICDKYNTLLFIKPFLSNDNRPFIVVLSPVAIEANEYHKEGEVLTTFKVNDSKRLNNYAYLYEKYKDGGHIIYPLGFHSENTHPPALATVLQERLPLEIVAFRLYADKVIDKNFNKQIFDEKNLNGYGDAYIVRDLRKRSKKEPNEIKSLKNFEFKLEEDDRLHHFNKDLYLAPSLNHYGTEKEVNGVKYKRIGYGISGSGFSFVYKCCIFVPTIFKKSENIMQGVVKEVERYVNGNEMYNLGRGYGWIKYDYYIQIYNEALQENLYREYNYLIDHRSSDLDYIKKELKETEKRIKYFILLYTNYDKYKRCIIGHDSDYCYNDLPIDWIDVEGLKDLIKKLNEATNSNLGKTANNALYNNNDIIECRGFKPTYKILSDYSSFFDEAKTQTDFAGYGLNDTLKLITETCRKHWKDCKKIAAHLKGDCKIQSAFNLWHWLRYNIRYEYDREGREEIRTPLRTWADRYRGVDCDCLSVFAWCVLKCMGYNPKFELVAFRNKSDYSHIFINLDGIIIDRVWYIFNSRPPMVTKSKLYNVELQNLGQLF